MEPSGQPEKMPIFAMGILLLYLGFPVACVGATTLMTKCVSTRVQGFWLKYTQSSSSPLSCWLLRLARQPAAESGECRFGFSLHPVGIRRRAGEADAPDTLVLMLLLFVSCQPRTGPRIAATRQFRRPHPRTALGRRDRPHGPAPNGRTAGHAPHRRREFPFLWPLFSPQTS